MSKLRRRLASTALTAGIALLLLPAAGQASQVFGSRLLGTPAEETPNVPSCTTLFGTACTEVAFINPTEPSGNPDPSGAPGNGVITKFRLKAIAPMPTQVTFRLAEIARADAEGQTATATAVGTGPTVTLATTPVDEAPIQEFVARVPARQGQHLALDSTDALVAHSANGSKFTYEFAPTLAEGRGANSAGVTGEMLIQAVLEPDADGDGFGDETQDGCPTQKGSHGACDLTKPGVTGLRVRRGKISYQLSEPATVSIALARRARRHFRKVGRKFSGPGNEGANRVAVPHARNLLPGRYRVTITATDAAGNTATKSAGFAVRG